MELFSFLYRNRVPTHEELGLGILDYTAVTTGIQNSSKKGTVDSPTMKDMILGGMLPFMGREQEWKSSRNLTPIWNLVKALPEV